jgi:hypothetical protein
VPETLTFICILPTSTLISANHIPNRMHDEQIMPKTDYQSSPTRKNSNSWIFSISVVLSFFIVNQCASIVVPFICHCWALWQTLHSTEQLKSHMVVRQLHNNSNTKTVLPRHINRIPRKKSTLLRVSHHNHQPWWISLSTNQPRVSDGVSALLE